MRTAKNGGGKPAPSETPSCTKLCDHRDVCKYFAGIAGFVFKEGGPKPPINPDRLSMICEFYTGDKPLMAIIEGMDRIDNAPEIPTELPKVN